MPQFRNAVEADIPAVVDLVQSAYRGDASRVGWTPLKPTSSTVNASMPMACARSSRNRIAASCWPNATAPWSAASRSKAGYFGMFSVCPNLQGGGIGDALLREAERVVREDFDCTTMTCTVISIRAELIAWYQRRGYRSTGEFKPFPYGDERFGLPKRDDLRFEVFAKDLT